MNDDEQCLMKLAVKTLSFSTKGDASKSISVSAVVSTFNIIISIIIIICVTVSVRATTK